MAKDVADILAVQPDTYPILSQEPLRANDAMEFSQEENDAFDARFDYIFKMLNVQGLLPNVTSEHKAWLRFCAQVQKKVFQGDSFTGDGVGGWGMRDIIPEDVFGDGAAGGGDDCWELGNGVVAGNWTVGAVASRFTRNDMGWTTRNTATFAAGAHMATLDANNDKWAVAYFGMADLASSGNVQGHVNSINNRPRDYTEFTSQMQLNNWTFADLGKITYYNHLHPFKSANIVRPATAAIGAAVGTVTAMRPIGVAFVTSRRALNPNTVTTPSQA